MAERQVIVLGRNCHVARGWILSPCPPARQVACRFSQRGKLCWTGQYLFASVAVETFIPLNTSARQLFANLEVTSGDDLTGK